MLTLRSLKMTNFGPFYGSQELLFPTEPGVTIVFGENGRGKTTLLNAFRFALFGIIKTRAAQQITRLDLLNSEARDAGEYRYTVVLRFDHDFDSYELTRAVAPRPDVVAPSSHLPIAAFHSQLISFTFVPHVGVHMPRGVK